jgi:hypothetical protein
MARAASASTRPASPGSPLPSTVILSVGAHPRAWALPDAPAREPPRSGLVLPGLGTERRRRAGAESHPITSAGLHTAYRRRSPQVSVVPPAVTVRAAHFLGLLSQVRILIIRGPGSIRSAAGDLNVVVHLIARESHEILGTGEFSSGPRK